MIHEDELRHLLGLAKKVPQGPWMGNGPAIEFLRVALEMVPRMVEELRKLRKGVGA